MPKYIVEVVMATCMEVEVEAHNEEEAQELAYEKADPFDAVEWDYDINSVYRNDEKAED